MITTQFENDFQNQSCKGSNNTAMSGDTSISIQSYADPYGSSLTLSSSTSSAVGSAQDNLLPGGGNLLNISQHSSRSSSMSRYSN